VYSLSFFHPNTLCVRSYRVPLNIRNRCNDYTHYNYFKNLIDNDTSLVHINRKEIHTQAIDDLIKIIVYHIGYAFYINYHYMSSSDYIDCFESGITPDKSLLFNVAPFVSDFLNKIVKIHNPEIITALKTTGMKIE